MMKKNYLTLVLTLFVASAFAQTQYPKVVFETTKGKMVIMLYDNTPLHSENFVKLANDGYYTDQLFHRVIKNFMIQSGDPNSKSAQPGQMLGRGGPGYTVPAEFKPEYYHKRGALAAARLGDNINPSKASSGSQFYIVHGRTFSNQELFSLQQRRAQPFTEEQKQVYMNEGGAPHLDYAYTVFGELVEGFEVLDAIATTPVTGERPTENIKILKVYTVKK